MAKSNIQKVAQEAGVSVATVSRAFFSPGVVSPGTLARVLAAADKLNYVPNAQARTLRTARSMHVVALVPDIGNSFFSEVIRGIELVASKHSYAVLLGDTNYQPDKEQLYADMVSGRQADGLITLLHRVPQIRLPGRIPVVNACEPSDDPEISSVAVDDRLAFKEATQFLVSLGHRVIAFVGSVGSRSANARYVGFQEALNESGIPMDPRLSALGDFSPEAGVRGADVILSYGAPVTAIMCASDELAIGVLQSVRAKGLRVPRDMSIIGYDDIEFARFTEPALTTVAQPRERIGSEAMLMLLQLLEDPETPPRRLLLPTQLVVRGSTAPPPSHPRR